MIVFYTRYSVVEAFDIRALFNLSFKCVTGMKNVPESFKNLSWNGTESEEWKDDRNLLAYEIDSDTGIVAFRISIVDSNDELWTTDIALNEKEHEIQLRLAREMKIISADYDHNFNIPYIFKKIIRDGLGGKDLDLPVSDEPIFIDESNLDVVSNLINGKKSYSLPVIYVSHPFYETDYVVDVNELAKDMAGSAHVLVEKSSETTKCLRELTESRNAYNGAVDIFYDDDTFRYLKWDEININQFRYRLSHAVYSRMAMRNIDDKSSLSTIRLKNKVKKLGNSILETQMLALEIEELKEKRKDDSDYIQLISDEIKTLEKKVNELENTNFELNSKVIALNAALNNKGKRRGNFTTIDYTEEEFYEDEIKRIVLECIRQTISSYGDEEQLRRDYHVLKDIIDNNTFSDEGESIKRSMLRIFKKNKLGKSDVNALRGLGFEVKAGSHDKYVFHGDDRYIVTISNSPSDYREGENNAHKAVNLIFGRT